MKRILLVIFTLCCLVPNSWGWFLDIHANGFHRGNSFLDDVLVKKRPLQVRVILPKKEEPRRNQYQADIAKAIKAWFTETSRQIEASGRANEVADAYNLLRGGIKVEFVKTGGWITFVISSSYDAFEEECGDSAVGCYSGQEVRIFLPTYRGLQTIAKKETLVSVATHEFGHALGFGEQYLSGVNEWADNLNNLYHSSKPMRGVMADDPGSPIGCDDVDAIINWINYEQFKWHKVKSNKPFKSFCKGSRDAYLNGRLMLEKENPFEIRLKNKPHGEYMLNGKETGLWYSPKQPLSPDLIMQNYGRMLRVPVGKVTQEGVNREEVYEGLVHGIRYRLAFLAGQMVWADVKNIPEKGTCTVHELYWGGNGTISSLKWCKYKPGEGEITYTDDFKSTNSYNIPGTEITLVCHNGRCALDWCQQYTDSYRFGRGICQQEQVIETSREKIQRQLEDWFKQVPL